MKKSEVKIGEKYRVKVSGSIVDVRITGTSANGGWDGVNIATKRNVRIKSAQRLRSLAGRPAKRKRIVSLAEYEAREQASAERAAQQVRKDIAKTVKAVQNGDLTKGVTVPTSRKKRSGITEANKADAVNKAMMAVAADKKKRSSGLDAAAKVLGEADAPLHCREMVEEMLTRGLWQTAGRTPASTIYAAILREIKTKGNDSRFRKAGRGKFELNR